MSTIADLAPPVPPAEAGKPFIDRFNGSPTLRVVAMALAGLVLLTIVRIIADAGDLTASSTMGTTLRLSVPILMAGMAGLWAERSGVVNIAIEGMMVFGTWFGAWGAWKFGPWQGIALGILGGMIGGLIHAVATVRFNVDHVISGVAINLLAVGGMRYLSELAFVGEPGGGISQSPKQKAAIPTVDVPFLAGGRIGSWKSPDILGWLERRHWAVIGDVAGLIRGLLVKLSWGSVLAIALVAVSGWVLWRTRFGLRLRSSGEDPTAAESLGVRIVRLRYSGLLISGGFAGFGGAYLSIVASSYYRQGQTANRGFIGLACTIFGNWRPAGVLGGAFLFGFSDAVKLLSPKSLPALFLFGSFVAGLIIIAALYRRRVVNAVGAAVVGILFLVVYLTVDEVPASLAQSTPYVVTLVVLAVASRRLRPPAFAGKPWRPGDSH